MLPLHTNKHYSQMMKYPIGIQNFEKLRSEGYVYVDKTPQMWKMISEGSSGDIG